MLLLFILLASTEICAAQNDVTLSVFEVKSKSITVQWSSYAGASSYKITATAKNSPEPSTFTQFGSNTVMGSVNSLSPNTVYTIQLEAMDNAFNVLSSAETEETTAPDVPSIEQVYSKHSDSITVEFTEVAGATSYILRAESETGDFFSERAVSSSPGTVVQLQPFTEYWLSVMSVNSGGRSQPSHPVKARTVVLAAELNVTSPSNNTILATWPPVEHAVLYALCIIQEGSSTRNKLNTTDTAVTFGDLEAGTTYCIKVTAWDSEGRPGDDITECQITRPLRPEVTYIQVGQGRSVTVIFYWAEVLGAEGYWAETTSGKICTSKEHTFCSITPVECGQNELVTVTAMNSGGFSSPSSPVGYMTYPCPPENVWVEEPEASNCSVVWGEVLMADYYMTFIKRDDGMESSCNTTETTCQFDCTCGYTYYTTVFPYNQAGSTPYTPVRNYTTIPCCPQDVAISLVSTETLEVIWSPVKGAELYQTTAVQTDDVIHCNDTAPVCALSDLRCNTKYTVTVTPCNDFSGCNSTCGSKTHETAPCAPEILDMTQANASTYTVTFTTPNTNNTNYTVAATGHHGTHTCHTRGGSCELTQLPCGSTYEVVVEASTAVGQSLPGYSKTLETGPCCPTSVNVTQVTQAMSDVSWSPGSARSYLTTLTSSRGRAQCHTLDTHCLMGCMTCGTNYNISMEAISSTGHKTECLYHGFSSSPCCPSGIKVYRSANNTVRVYWRPLGPQIHGHTVHLYGAGANNNCTAAAGFRYCDIEEANCGHIYRVLVVPAGQDEAFCQPRAYSVLCPGSNPSMLIRGRRSAY